MQAVGPVEPEAFLETFTTINPRGKTPLTGGRFLSAGNADELRVALSEVREVAGEREPVPDVAVEVQAPAQLRWVARQGVSPSLMRCNVVRVTHNRSVRRVGARTKNNNTSA